MAGERLPASFFAYLLSLVTADSLAFVKPARKLSRNVVPHAE